VFLSLMRVACGANHVQRAHDLLAQMEGMGTPPERLRVAYDMLLRVLAVTRLVTLAQACIMP
jgi:pentatricopeptide repeat protein